MQIRASGYEWVGHAALLGVVAAIMLIGVGTGGIGLLLFIPFAFVVDTAILRSVRKVMRRRFQGKRND